MLKSFDHVSFEHVCSGIGIPYLYRYLRDVEHLEEKPDVAKLIDSTADASVVTINQAIDPVNPSKLCAATVDLFVSILAGEAGNLAVKALATGGVYLAGGVVVHTLRVIEGPGFMQRFKRKGRFAELMGRIPIHVVVTPAAITGAAAYGLENSIPNSSKKANCLRRKRFSAASTVRGPVRDCGNRRELAE